jgi:hypothetical protein
MFNKVLGSVAQNLTNKTYLQGLADAVGFISKPQEAASRYVSSLAGSVVPNIIGKATQAIDSTVRDTTAQKAGLLGLPEKVTKTIASRLPGVSTLLPERKTATGETAERPGNAFTRFALPAQITSEKSDKALERLLVDVDAVPGQPSRDFTVPGGKGKKVRLTDTEYRVLQEGNRKASEIIRRSYLRNARFLRLEAEEQKKLIERLYQQERQRARDRLVSNRTFRQRIMSAPA